MTDNRKPSSIRGHAANDCPGIDECGQASSMREQLSELTAAQARQESQLRLLHTGHQHLAQQLAEVAVTLHKRERESEQLSDRMGLIETAAPVAPVINITVPEQPPAQVTVEAPHVTVNPPQITVEAPQITVEAPATAPPAPQPITLNTGGGGRVISLIKDATGQITGAAVNDA